MTEETAPDVTELQGLRLEDGKVADGPLVRHPSEIDHDLGCMQYLESLSVDKRAYLAEYAASRPADNPNAIMVGIGEEVQMPPYVHMAELVGRYSDKTIARVVERWYVHAGL